MTVRGTDFRTGAPLANGIVMVDGTQVGNIGVPFTFTFNSRFEEEWVPELQRSIRIGPINPVITVNMPGYPEVEVPVTYFTPRLDVRMVPASVPIGPTSQVIVRAQDATSRTPVQGRVMIAGRDVGATNQPFSFAFAPTYFRWG